MLRVSVNGGTPVAAESVVVYDDDKPVVISIYHNDAVFYADSVRDPAEFIDLLDYLGIKTRKLHEPQGHIKGSMK